MRDAFAENLPHSSDGKNGKKRKFYTFPFVGAQKETLSCREKKIYAEKTRFWHQENVANEGKKSQCSLVQDKQNRMYTMCFLICVWLCQYKRKHV